MDYKILSEIIVKTQAELDMIPLDFEGEIYIEFGDFFKPAIVKNRYHCQVIVKGNSSVVARGNSSVEARGNSSVEAWGNSSVEAWENSSVVAWGNSSVFGGGNAQITSCPHGRIEIIRNARIVYNPKDIMEYLDFYEISHDKNTCILYKAVRKKENGKLVSDRDNNFAYTVGEFAKCKEELDTDVMKNCGSGIHIAHLAWCLNYGKDWDDLCIIECEAQTKNIVVPLNGCGKVRTDKVRVLREVPLEECGIYVKILAKRQKTVK